MRAVNHDDGRDHDHHHGVDGQGVPADVALAQAEVGGLKRKKNGRYKGRYDGGCDGKTKA